MAKLKPTIEEVKEDLRIPTADTYDDAVIGRYIAAAAESCFSDLHWIRGSNEGLLFDYSRIILGRQIRLPVRGISDTWDATQAFTARIIYDDLSLSQEIQIETSQEHPILETRIDRNRYIAHLVIMPGFFNAIAAVVAAQAAKPATLQLTNIPAADAPQILLTAITKMAVDLYHHNGVGSMPMMTAVARLLDPIRDHG